MSDFLWIVVLAAGIIGAVQGYLLLPIYRIIEYLAELDTKYASLRDELTPLKFNEAAEGGAALFSLVVLLIALMMLVTAPRETKYNALVMIAASSLPIMGLIANWQTTKLRQRPSAAATFVSCPKCSAIVPNTVTEAAEFVCPACNHHFTTNPLRAPGWLIGAFILAGWGLATEPWLPGFSSPISVALCSALAGVLCLVVPVLVRLQRARENKHPIDVGPCKDLALACAVMTATGVGFALLNRYVDELGEVGTQDHTIRQALAAQVKLETIDPGTPRLRSLAIW